LADLAPLDLAPKVVDGLADGGWLRRAGGRLVATPEGRAVLDRITLDLAASAGAG